MPLLLVVDNDALLLEAFRCEVEQEQLDVLVADCARDGLRLIAEREPDVVFFDASLPDQAGPETFRKIQEIDAKLPVVFITSSGASDAAIGAMKLGALDYLVKPLDFAQVRRVVQQALQIRHLMNEPVQVSQAVGEAPVTGDVLVGRCPAMQLVYKAIGRVAPQNVTVLIRGESGTGKELVARALYQHSKRSDGPFMEVNSAAIPDALLESELFGHEKGAFTGADRKRIGKFEQCNGGTLFLDEIGDMTPTLQSKLLRVLQDGRFERVGGNETIRADVRGITATNRDLDKMVADGTFRSDLYYRLNGFTIKLPPLRLRGDDLLLLVDHFLARANHDLGKNVRGLSPETLDTLKRYPWPGNVRELQSVVRQTVLQSSGPVLLADFLPDFLSEQVGEPPPAPPSPPSQDYWDQFVAERIQASGDRLYDEALARMESEVITRVLKHTGGNQVEAAKLLGITRTTLRTKIRQAGIAIDRVIR